MAMEGLTRTKVTLFIFLLLFSIVNVFGLPNNILMKCQSQCASNMTSSSEGGSELFCNRDCRIDQCNSGCKLYKNAADSSCPKVCASAYPRRSETSSKETATQDWIRNCGQGCMFALHTYLYNVLGAMEQPRPQRDSIGHSSVTLTWTRPHVNNVTLTFRVYVRVVHVDSGWQHHKDCEFKSEKIILTNLHPYVTYQFKVLALLSTRFIDESRETVEITTLPRGNPSTSPTITSISTPSPTVISLSWKPPVYTNGKLLSYRIYVEPVGHPLLNHTTIEIPHNATSWLLSQLKSSQPYIISMSARNAEGEGPRSTKTISTPNPGNLSAQETPYLILGSANKIVKRNILEVIDYSDTIHSLDDRTVRGLSLHIRRQLLLASDSAGYVLRVSLAGLNNRKKNDNDNMDDDHKNEVRLLSDNHYPSILGARAISIDWLADKVYVASWNRITWQIHSCPLDQDLCVAVVKNVHRPITDVKVDPINGYLYYVINGAGHGLYRVDLQDITNLLMPKSPQSPRNPFSPFHPVAPLPALITGMPDLFTLVLDFSSVHLYLVNDTTKTMMSAFLDGTNMQPFHHNNINSAFKHVTSSVFYNETFIWTDNSEMYVESYESHSKIYHHNELLFFSPNYTGISIYHPTAQPIPVPSVAPDELEVLFTKDKGVIQWRPPQPLQYQGRGAWSNWTYELQITPLIEVNSMTSSTMKAVNIDKLTVDNLKPDSEYAVKIRAKSSIGFGPWSDAFIGRTLKEDGLKVLMGVEGGRIVEKEIGASSHHTAINLYNEAFDIAWHDDRVLWITADALSVTVMNVTTNSKRELTAARGAVCISFDWLGQKVYWGAWHEQEIRRADIDGVTSSSEYIQRSVAMDLAVDAVAGRLYWATQHSIETSFLNGEEHQELFAIKFFSGRQVISLALDSESSKVFWYVKGYQSQGLYMTEMMQTNDGQYFSPGYKHIGDFGTISSESGLQYFSGKLFWLTERNSLVVGDGTCNFTASVSEFSNITAFTVKHPQIHKLPNGLSKGSVRVIPDPIRSEDIKTVGKWSHFNLTWPLSKEVNHGTVFYKVVVEDIGRGSGPGTLSQNWYELSGLSPYTKLDVSIQPYTVWGYADPTTVSVRSPMSEPSAPLSPEVYIKPFKTSGASASSLAADFRWDSPRSTNGLISHHVVNHWMGAGNVRHDFKSDRVSSTARHFILANLTKSQTYHFNVVACNDAGCGPPSETKTATTDAVNPVPTLLISSKKGLTMTEMAGRLNSTAMTDIALEAVTFLAHDPPRLFWMDQRGNYLYENVKDPHKELTKLNGRGRDLTIDWISRTLYIVEWTGDRESTITEFNIDTKAYEQLVVRPAVIGDLIADPYNSAVLWTETDSMGRGQMFSIDLNTRKIRVVIGSSRSSRDRSRRSACSCGDSMDVSSAMAIDYASGDGSTRILFTDMNTKAIYYSDLDGCDCQKLLPLSSFDGLDTAPDMLAVDHLQVSCYSKAQGKLYSVKKSERRINIRENIPNVLDIVAFGSHLQPLPDSACLDPGAYNSTVQGLQVRDTSIELRLSAPTRPDMCKKISTPVDKYTVYYKPLLRTKPGTVPGDCQSEIATCLKENSYNTQVTLPGLIPYTPYLIQVAVSNYYTEYLSEQMGTAITIQTKSGVPSNPKVVNATSLTPEKIMVRWSPPDNFNGPASQISYTVQYITTTTEGFEQKEMQYPAKSSRLMTFFLQDLRPDHTYSISIQTCPEDKFKCNMTKAVQATTFKTPLDFAFISTTHNSVEIHWKIPNNESINLQTILFSEMSPEVEPQWEPAEFIVFDKKTHEFKENITHLKPYTHYAFVIQISYDARPYDRAYYRWPLDDPFTTRTLAYIPGKPEIPIVSHLDSGAYEVSWEEPEDNGAAITQYILQYRDHHKNSWHAAYDGPKARWLVEEATLDNDHYYIFRVAAVNAMGQGQYSDNSTLFMASYGKALEGSFTTEVTIGIIVGSILLLGFFVLVVILILRKRFGRIKTHQFIIRGPDNELATLRELPHTTFQQSNTLYAISIQCTDEEIAKLPHFSRSQLVLHTFLGSGAFGEVFEGFAKNILGNESGETKCAVKTLRKSASDQEKQEFLKEALLMKNFQHDHILSLLGVCLDNDPQFIIMELMEGGDLLSFIRSCRATSTTPAKLMLPELVKICVHVARGCKYLEDMHFVHRDLAARNCLVSSKSPSDMIVKIGDFGLARDIYKNDYYRKEGEGLLPVRWMSPESLVDGFFTTQSDIWAFGVMMWEVITLGQQPYPARTNIEVLHFVRAGGKLERPERCADEMYSLMRKCWSFDAEERPCFADILSTLEEFEEKCIHMTFEEIARLSPLSVDANPCMSYHHSTHPPNHHHNHNHLHPHHPPHPHPAPTSSSSPVLTNTQRPLPEIPIINPILLNNNNHLYHRVHYSPPWDIAQPYANPWESTNYPIHRDHPNNTENHPNAFQDSSVELSSLYQFSNFGHEYLDLCAQNHEYLLPSNAQMNSDQNSVTLINGAEDFSVKSGYDENNPQSDNGMNMNNNVPCPTQHTTGQKRRNKKLHIFSSPRIDKSRKLKKKNKALKRITHKRPDTANDNNKLYSSMAVVGRESSSHDYETMDSKNIDGIINNNNNNNNNNTTSAFDDNLNYCSSIPPESNNEDNCPSCSKEYKSHLRSDTSSPTLNRCSPDEGICSPSLSNFRKTQSLSVNDSNSKNCNFCRSNSWTYSPHKARKLHRKRFENNSARSFKSKTCYNHPSSRSRRRRERSDVPSSTSCENDSMNCDSPSHDLGIDLSPNTEICHDNDHTHDNNNITHDNLTAERFSKTPPRNNSHYSCKVRNDTKPSSHQSKRQQHPMVLSRHEKTLGFSFTNHSCKAKNKNDTGQRPSHHQSNRHHRLVLLSCHVNENTEKTLGFTNIAFTDEAANRELGVWTSDEEEEDESEEAAETRGLFTPKCQTITGGGSVRATQSDKAKRLSDLLGTTDKVVDLTKIKRKRNHSDSKQYSPISSSPYHHSNFPAAGEYDRHGYLEPRGAKGGSRYLDLVNYAPELRHLLDAQGKPLVSGNGSAFTPVHVSHKGYHPSNPAYSLVAHDEEQEDEIPYGHMVGKRQGAPTNNNNNNHNTNANANGIHSVDNPNYSSEFCDRIIPPASANDYPIYAEVCDARRHNSTDSTGGRYTDYHYNSPSLSATMMKSPRRKFSDQDLYSSPASYRQYPESETNNFDPRYTSLECNNNHYNSSNGNNYSYGPLPSRSRHRHSSSNSNRSRESIPNYHHYAKPGLCSSFCQEQPLCVDLSNTSHNSKMSLSAISANQDQWANNPDDVFLDSDCHGDNMMSSQHSYNSNGHQNQSGPPRSRHQVFPEGNPDFSNFTHGHVSLV